MKPVELILERAEGVWRVGSGWMVSCPLPGHGRGFGDRKPSVSVTEGDDSRALVKCQAGCQTEDIVAEWGLNMSDLFENRNVHRGGESYTPPENESTRYCQMLWIRFRSRGDLLFASFDQLSVFECCSGPHQSNQVMSV